MNDFLTLLDIAHRNGSDQVVGLIEEGITFVPEVGVLRGRTIRGTSYKALVRTSRPTAGFRDANEGVNATRSTYTSKTVECFILDAQMQVDKAVADANEFGREALLADEAMGQFQGSLEAYAAQIYYGNNGANDRGFDGLLGLIDTATMGVNAGGDTADACTSVYLIWNDVRGVYPIFGADGQIQMNDEWTTQQVQDANGKLFTAYVNGATGWMGLQFHHEAASRIYNIDFDHKLTDKLIAEAIQKHPVGKRPNRILMNRRAAFQLQESRSAVGGVRSGQKTSSGVEVWAPEPTESNSVPITITEAILDTEAVV